MARILIKPVISSTRNGEHDVRGLWYRQAEDGACYIGVFPNAQTAIDFTIEQGDVAIVDVSHVKDLLTLKNAPPKYDPPPHTYCLGCGGPSHPGAC